MLTEQQSPARTTTAGLASGFDPQDAGFLQAIMPLLRTDPGAALAFAQAELAKVGTSRDRAAPTRLLVLLAKAQQSIADPAAAASSAMALDSAVEHGDAELLGKAIVTRFGVLRDLGQFADALELCQRGVAMLRGAGRDDLATECVMDIGSCLATLGEHLLALEFFGLARRLLVDFGHPNAAAKRRILDNNEADLLHALLQQRMEGLLGGSRQDALQRARELATRCCEELVGYYNLGMVIDGVSTLIDILLESGQFEAARSWAARAQARGLSKKLGTAWAEFQCAMARIDLSDGADPKRALSRLQDALETGGAAFAQGKRSARVLQLMSIAHEQLGDFASALAWHDAWTAEVESLRSVVIRERVKLVQKGMIAWRNEAIEFLAHDARNPLSVALAQLDAVSAGAAPARSAPQSVADAALPLARAAQSADQFLGLLRAEGIARDAMDAIDLGALADDVCESVAAEHMPRVQLRRNIKIGSMVRGDRSLLARALDGLLSEVCARAPTGSDVDVLVHSVEGARVRVEVRRVGAEFPTAERLRLFKRFSTRDGDSALGMLLVGRVARLHRARVALRGASTGNAAVVLDFPGASDAGGQASTAAAARFARSLKVADVRPDRRG